MSNTRWSPPVATGPLDAEVTLPGSKSATARALVLALLAASPTRIRGALQCRDTDLMVAGLREFGAEVEVGDDGTIDVRPPAQLRPGTGRLDCGLAGTVMRFLAPVAALAEGDVTFDGDEAARRRPMRGLLDALKALGVRLTWLGEAGCLPVTIHGAGRVAGGAVTLDASASSQFLSALLLAGARFDQGVEVHTIGAVPSLPHVHMTRAALTERGVICDITQVTVTQGTDTPLAWRVQPGPIAGGEVVIEPDLTNAGPFLAAPLVAGGQVRVLNWPAHTTQPGDAWRQLLTVLGGRANRDDDGHFLAQYMGPISGATLDMGDLGELVPTVAALAALAVSPTTLTGIRHLRGHETDRLAALEQTLRHLGCGAVATLGSLQISPAPLHAATVPSFGDHRMVMFAAILGLAVPGIEVEGVEAVTKTFPGFPGAWEAMVRGSGA